MFFGFTSLHENKNIKKLTFQKNKLKVMAEDFHHSSTKVKKEKKRGFRIKMSMSSYRQDHPPSHFLKKLRQSQHQDLS